MGESTFAMAFVRPLFSAIFIKPFHKQTIPKSFIASDTATAPLSITAVDREPILPLKTAHINENTIIKGQI